ncbi:hypothetical protein XENOCAPTIV_030644, partial [Xenoophorus captivus]
SNLSISQAASWLCCGSVNLLAHCNRTKGSCPSASPKKSTLRPDQTLWKLLFHTLSPPLQAPEDISGCRFSADQAWRWRQLVILGAGVRFISHSLYRRRLLIAHSLKEHREYGGAIFSSGPVKQEAWSTRYHFDRCFFFFFSPGLSSYQHCKSQAVKRQ